MGLLRIAAFVCAFALIVSVGRSEPSEKEAVGEDSGEAGPDCGCGATNRQHTEDGSTLPAAPDGEAASTGEEEEEEAAAGKADKGGQQDDTDQSRLAADKYSSAANVKPSLPRTNEMVYIQVYTYHVPTSKYQLLS